MKWFKRKPLIVEIEKPRALQPLDPETAKSVAILAEFPGFQYLLAKCRFQGAILKSTLDKQRQRSLDDVAFLQAGIAWCGWLENELATAIPTDEGLILIHERL